jgi:hypothetical protein
MNSDPILDELWTIKDNLAREAENDPERFAADLRRWEAEHLELIQKKSVAAADVSST